MLNSDDIQRQQDNQVVDISANVPDANTGAQIGETKEAQLTSTNEENQKEAEKDVQDPKGEEKVS